MGRENRWIRINREEMSGGEVSGNDRGISKGK